MENLQFNADTNWYDELLRTAMMTNHSLNISGGTEKATYSAGMSYLAQDGSPIRDRGKLLPPLELPCRP